jgi:endoglucanase
MVDIHNFARWNGGIIGQGGPTDDQFVSLWTQLATKYKNSTKVVFELMNEPHDLDITLWAATCQKVVTAIRNTGATSQMILLPGTNFDSAATLVSSGSAAALMAITNPDGSTTGLLLDVHKYLDEDNSGTHAACTTDNTAAFQTVADFLRQSGRRALVTETGASSDSTCLTAFCAQNAFINANSDVYVGLVAWAAGSFSTSYILSLTPTKSGNSYVDNTLAKQCVIGTWLNSTTTTTGTATTSVIAATTTAIATGKATTTSSLPTTLVIDTSAAPTVTKSKGTATKSSGSGTTTTSAAEVQSTGTGEMTVTMTGTATESGDTLLVATGSPTGFTLSKTSTLATATGSSSNATRTGSTTTATQPVSGASVVEVSLGATMVLGTLVWFVLL